MSITASKAALRFLMAAVISAIGAAAFWLTDATELWQHGAPAAVFALGCFVIFVLIGVWKILNEKEALAMELAILRNSPTRVTVDLADAVAREDEIRIAKAEIAELKTMAARRKLSDLQMEMLRQFLSTYTDWDVRIWHIDAESRAFANDFYRVFKEAGWGTGQWDSPEEYRSIAGIMIITCKENEEMRGRIHEDFKNCGIKGLKLGMDPTGHGKLLTLLIGGKEPE